MSKAEEKTLELMKKAKDFIPDGGYSEKELNLAFFMFINGYHQAEKDIALTWQDVKAIFLLVQVEWRPNKKEEEIYQEVLKRFNKERKQK